MRDQLGDALGKKAAKVTGGFNKKTGDVAAGRSCGSANCAEDVVVEALGGKKDDVIFTKAKRPRTGNEQPICKDCQDRFKSEQFPSDAKRQ